MKKKILSTFIAVLILFGAWAVTSAGKGQGKGRGKNKAATEAVAVDGVAVFQGGVEVTEVFSLSDFEIRGGNLLPDHEIFVCLNPGLCHTLFTDGAGAFSEVRNKKTLSTYIWSVQVYAYVAHDLVLLAETSLLIKAL